MRGQHDDRPAIAVAAQLLDGVAAVDVGQADVHDHEIGRRVRDRRQRRLGRLDSLDLKLRMQGDLLDQRAAQVGVVVHDQDSPRLAHGGTLPTALSGG